MVVKSLGADEISWSKIWDQGLLAAFLCVVYFGYCLASFIQARRSTQ